ncbi:hypothetical protein D9613_004082 [Agrocybe pediades]|uniref:Enoyl reductase (ER) domain-containing protein n=1 Tax=Agrocybe pediades TaxID=84607 RepID=A0A8H4VKT5_9AGAR|nr:hypothetical protein D9613_004082 [Agrocybe pediades]
MTTHSAVAATSKGAFDVIQVPTPVPEGDEVLIKVEYGAMIAFDTYVTDRGYMVNEFPMTLGFSASGTIDQVGPNVHDFKKGDRVTAFTYSDNGREGLKSRFKALQEYTIQSRKKVAKIPDSLSLAEAATIPDNFVTAFYTIFSQLGLPIPSSFPATTPPPLASTPILIYGAGSTAGVYAVQLLHLAGYRRIIATASKKHHDYLRELGAHDTFDYNSPTLVEDVAKAAGGDGKLLLALDCITAEGTLAILGKMLSPLGKVALLLPIKQGNTVTNGLEQEMYFELPDEKNPFPKGTEVILVRTFLYIEDERMSELMPKILPDLLQHGYIKPARVRLMDSSFGSLKERVGAGLALLRENKISGEKVVVKMVD